MVKIYIINDNYKLKIFFLIIALVLIYIFSIDLNFTNIPELEFYNNQTLKLLVPSKRCKPPAYKTLYLTSDYKNDSNKIIKKYKIVDYKNKKNSYITYYSDNRELEQYKYLLFKQGLINSDSIFGDNNFYFTLKTTKLLKYNKSFVLLNHFKKFDLLFNYEIFSKDILYMMYLNMKKIFKKEYNYMPETYNYPNDKDIIEKKFMNYTLDINDLWLVKPKNDFGGRGIQILDSFKNISKAEFLITKYITNIDLINYKKYDLRLYILISGLKPLRIYFYREGLVRIATNNFTLDSKSINNKFIHLTNIKINRKNKDFIVPNNTNIEKANVWNIQTYSNHLKNIHVNYEKIRNNIKDIIIKSIISFYQNLTLELNQNNLNDINFYEILGYDIIIKDNYEPILLEINSHPSKIIHNNLDNIIKTNLFIDTMNLIGVSIFSKNIITKKLFKYKKYDLEDHINNALCELTRPRGDYELIFPLKTNINTYKKYFRNINCKENELFWEKIKKNSDRI